MKFTSLITAATGALLLQSACVLHADNGNSNMMEQPFIDGGRVHIKLSAGRHRIMQSVDDHIRVIWRVDDEEDLQKVDASADVEGSAARIELDGPRNDFETIIKVPKNTHLTVRMTAGELFVSEIIGDKDIRLRAGNLDIEVEDSNAYAHVEGSLWAGDIDAGPFNETASGLFRSIEWQGEGRHDLQFKLYAGDVKLHTGSLQD